MPIREFFHLIHVVDDIALANERFGALFGEVWFNENWSELDRRRASFMMLGDTMVELIQPSDAPEDRNQALTKFHNRFGQHLHSLSWYVDVEDMPALFERFLSEGVRIVKPGGGAFPEGTKDPGQTIFTHPKDTAGQMEFVGVEGGPLTFDPRSNAAWTPTPAVASPLTLVGVSHFTMGIVDPPKQKGLYEWVMSAQTLREEESSIFLRVGSHSVVELAAPVTKESLLGRDVASNGELPHAVTFRVVDLEAAERHAATVGVRVFERAGRTMVLAPDDMFGAVIALTDESMFD
jgi:Glyoxalase/Bleomycin resistance protein/Dioxygenase superfamily